MFVGDPPAELARPARFAEVARAVRAQGALLIGLRAAGGAGRLNPADDGPVAPGTRLVYLAERPVLEGG